MAGLPEEIKKKLLEGSPLTPEESKVVAEHNAYLEKEAKEAFARRDEAKKRAEALEDAERARKTAEESEVQKAQREKSEAVERAKALEAEAEEGRRYRAAKIEEYKKAFGDAWDDSYANLPLVALDKLAAKLNEKKPGVPAPPGSASEGPKDYAEYLRSPARFGEWGEKNREQLERMKSEWQANQRGRR
jgi:hypothetical protein